MIQANEGLVFLTFAVFGFAPYFEMDLRTLLAASIAEESPRHWWLVVWLPFAIGLLCRSVMLAAVCTWLVLKLDSPWLAALLALFWVAWATKSCKTGQLAVNPNL